MPVIFGLHNFSVYLFTKSKEHLETRLFSGGFGGQLSRHFGFVGRDKALERHDLFCS